MTPFIMTVLKYVVESFLKVIKIMEDYRDTWHLEIIVVKVTWVMENTEPEHGNMFFLLRF
jgi:hypothetical protein